MDNVDSNVWVALVSTIGAVTTTYITVRYSDKKKREAAAPNSLNPTDSIFNGYERLIKNQQLDIERKTQLIEHLQVIVDAQRKEIEKSQKLINTLRDELEENKEQTQMLSAQLAAMKTDFKIESK